jgi:hypothetical protein
MRRPHSAVLPKVASPIQDLSTRDNTASAGSEIGTSDEHA